MERPRHPDTPEHRDSRHRWLVGALIGSNVLTLAAAGGLIWAERDNDARYADAVTIAQKLAATRNTCRVESSTPAQLSGRPALRVTIRIAQGRRPESLNGIYDGFGSTITFSDQTGNLVSGASAVSLESGPSGHVGGEVMDLDSGNTPDAATNVVTIPVDHTDRSLYGPVAIYRINAIDVTASSPGGSSTVTVVQKIPCGVVNAP